MPGFVLDVATVLTCFHQAPAKAVPTNSKVLVMGKPALTVADACAVSACPFQIPVGAGTKPQPCVTIKWVPATKVFAMGKALLAQATPGPGPGVCYSAESIPQGAPNATGFLQKVSVL